MVEEWSKGERILLKRFDDYWQGPAPQESILSLSISEWSTKYLMFREGDIDIMSPSSPARACQPEKGTPVTLGCATLLI